jgi:hypothetical protein
MRHRREKGCPWFSLTVSVCLLLGTGAGHAEGISREKVIEKASTYANLTWLCTKKNAKKDYNLLTPGKQYKGVPYNWGGFDSEDKFVKKVKSGVVAGNYKKRCGDQLCIRQDFAGLDCSGLVSRSWGTGRYTTTTLPGISIKIPRELLRPGDILNSEKEHVMLFDRFDEENQMWVYEAAAWVRVKSAPPAGVVYRSVDLDDDYMPRRYYKFIEPGERIRTDRTIIALRQINGKHKIYVPGGVKGKIVKGPTLSSKGRRSQAPTDVWVYIIFDNGSEGWAAIRHLTLVAAKA